MPPLRALLLSDGRPGHYHLAEGILAAIARRRPVETERIEVRRRRWLPGRILAVLINAGMPPRQVLRLGYGLSVTALARADLVVSAGGDTLAANIAAARLLRAPNIFYGSLRRFRPGDFALVLTSHARNATHPRIVMTLKPAAADQPPLPPRDGPPAIAGVLIGGDTSTIRFEAGDWQRLEGFLEAFTRTTGARWIVSNSRRTPAEATESLARLAARPASPILELIDIARAGAGSLGTLFARSELILCTVDSSSMLSEAVWMRRPVLAVAPAHARVPEPEAQYRRYLEANHWARAMAIADLTPERVLALLREMTPLDTSPLDRLSAVLADRLPQLFAPK
jgi:hypothetical protein